jgi:hypothetical protein
LRVEGGGVGERLSAQGCKTYFAMNERRMID